MVFGNPINKNGLASELMNLLPYYIKPVIYGTDDKEVIALKEKALRDVYAGQNCAENCKIKDAIDFTQTALNIFVKTNDELLEAFCCFFMGELYLRENMLNEAKEYFKRAYQIFDLKKNLMFIAAGQKIRDIDRELKGEKPEFDLTKLFPGKKII